MFKMKQDPYNVYKDAGFIFLFVDVYYITISALVPAFRCKLESRKQYQVKTSHGTQHVVLYV
jgi:hypothetical protein